MANITQKYHWLRKRAEGFLNENKKNPNDNEVTHNVEDINVLVHELEVHKIELEMQNSALEATQEELETSRMMYFDLYDNAPAGYITLDDSGIIRQANLTIAQLLDTDRSTLTGKDLYEYVSYSERDNLYLHLQKVFDSSSIQVTGFWMNTHKDRKLWGLIQSRQVNNNKNNALCNMIISDFTNHIPVL